MNWKIAALLLWAAPAWGADLPRTPSPPGVELYFISPQDGATLASPVTVRFGLKGMGIAPAGIAMENTGHHHLLIDSGVPPPNLPVPADERHLHFGKGQTEATISLTPGVHRLILLLGDHRHIPHEPPVMSAPLTITVR